MIVLTKCCHYIGQNLIAGSFATSSGTDKHNTETHIKGLVKIDDFLHEGFEWLFSKFSDGKSDLLEQHTVVGIDNLNCGEEILNNGCKQR